MSIFRHNVLRKATALTWLDNLSLQASPATTVEKVTFDYQDPDEGFYIYEIGRVDEIGEVIKNKKYRKKT